MISGGSGLLSFQHRANPEKAKEVMAKKKLADIRNMMIEDFKVTPGDEVRYFHLILLICI